MHVVVDTNVILVANGSHADASPDCVDECVARLERLMATGKVVIDDAYRILNEYQNKTSPVTSKRPGDVFVKWLLRNSANTRHVERVSLAETAPEVFVDFPAPGLQAVVDAPDRKFIAAAGAHPRRPQLWQATDCKWRLVAAAAGGGCHGGVSLPGRRMPLLPKKVPEPRRACPAMTNTLVRFPRTPHLMWLGKGAPRDDKLLSPPEASALLDGEVVVEEKVDGANLAFSMGPTGRLQSQSRGQFVQPPYAGQFAKLSEWRTVHGDALEGALEPGSIAYGEWCAARHSLRYNRLPDWWLLFDLYDRHQQRFHSTVTRNAFATKAGLAVVAELYRGRITLAELQQLLMDTISRYRAGPLEGLVIRREDGYGLRARAKLVRPEFTQSIDQHWRSRRLEWNRRVYAPADAPFLEAPV